MTTTEAKCARMHYIMLIIARWPCRLARKSQAKQYLCVLEEFACGSHVCICVCKRLHCCGKLNYKPNTHIELYCLYLGFQSVCHAGRE